MRSAEMALFCCIAAQSTPDNLGDRGCPRESRHVSDGLPAMSAVALGSPSVPDPTLPLHDLAANDAPGIVDVLARIGRRSLLRAALWIVDGERREEPVKLVAERSAASRARVE
ncbi:hypothetical protein OV079_49305 [Nannocystis pusilla]|uniref:Uncharacterized protein n=1 Tax=Nannocystis pusilla TaxID=889268 RepID=A0A9X3F7W9_9BACT|nr:hypothetical protein [Nannocystis pusilla]MCY1013398.1 hypothetical protein [Nannocystis pusilla]